MGNTRIPIEPIGDGQGKSQVLGGFFQRVFFLQLARKLLRDGGHFFGGLLLAVLLLDLGSDFLKRAFVSALVILDLGDVITILEFEWFCDFAFFQAENVVFHVLGKSSAINPADFTSQLFCLLVLGIFLGEILKLGLARKDLLPVIAQVFLDRFGVLESFVLGRC